MKGRHVDAPRLHMRMTPRSLRARVTLAFAIGAFLAVGLCFALLYVTLERQLAGALDADLRSRAGDLSAAVEAEDPGVLSRDPLAQLYGADGAVLAGSPSLGDRRLLSADEVSGLQGESLETRSMASDGAAEATTVRLLSRRLDESRC